MELISEEEWVAMTYAECKKMDEEYGTSMKSPLHRSRRFPVQWAEELESNMQWLKSCL